MKLSIGIPAHNEERRIGKTLESYSSYFEGLRKSKILDYEMIVVINNTKDKTEKKSSLKMVKGEGESFKIISDPQDVKVSTAKRKTA